MKLYNCDCLNVMDALPVYDCIFADPPDNIGLKYNGYKDKLSEAEYVELLKRWLMTFTSQARTVWFSFNAKWTLKVGRILDELMKDYSFEVKPCQQVFTFGQHRQDDFGNSHRPLYRIRWQDGLRCMDQIRVPSWRQLNGDKRADPRGRVPGDVFDVPRVTGNSKQRRRWHPTQLHEELVERCIKSCTLEGGTVCDPFAGTGTVLRVCKRINRDCDSIEIDPEYCQKIATENNLIGGPNCWSL